MKLGSKYDLLDARCHLKYRQIYWSKYMQGVEKIQWKLYEELISQCMQYQPLFTRSSCRKMAKSKTS